MDNLGVDTCNSQTQIVPILIGDEKKAMLASEMLLNRNIFIPAARWPAVPKNMARLRITFTCDHAKDQIDTLIEGIKFLKSTLKF